MLNTVSFSFYDTCKFVFLKFMYLYSSNEEKLMNVLRHNHLERRIVRTVERSLCIAIERIFYTIRKYTKFIFTEK